MKVGILGGGQLGRMLALAGYPLGLTFRFFDPNPESPAGQIGELITASYDDEGALRGFASDLDVATFEFESVPRAAADVVSRFAPVRPDAAALAATQDRLAERELLESVGIRVAPYAAVSSGEELSAAAGMLGYPLILKARRLGYDGKGQVRLEADSDLAEAWQSIGARPAIVERVVEFTRELSVLAVRAPEGSIAAYPLIENHHSTGILRFSFAPAAGTERLQPEAEAIARAVAEALNYVGVLAIELFETDEGLVANEIAPRVHNSGHWTMDGAETSQFENHLRAILGMPLGSTSAIGYSGMVNILGSIPELRRLLAIPGAHVHLYGKSASHRRKLGHVNVRAESASLVKEAVGEIRRAMAAS
ncbi:MAG TPA: 5-(carboxyamino)imidazole ribonucleotide synthase [Gemmatimonadaceae bacterium]|nr:5-(carboxyamino)imidazole ribonucleotide synthase [Gemmatimonadaceae bacterium]